MHSDSNSRSSGMLDKKQSKVFKEGESSKAFHANSGAVVCTYMGIPFLPSLYCATNTRFKSAMV